MTAVAAALYLLLGVVGGGWATRRMLPAQRRAPLALRIALGATLVIALLLAPLFLLGAAELATGRPLARIEPALLLLAALGGAWLAGRHRTAAAASPAPASDAGDVASGLAVWVAIFTAVVFAVVGAMVVTGFPRGFEVAAYVLPTAVHWLQTGSLLPWDHAFPHAYPLNAQLIYGLLLAVLPQTLVAGASLPFAAVLAVCTFGLARACGGTVTSSLLAACGMLSIPLVAFGSLELAADVPGIALLAAAACLLLAGEPLGPRGRCLAAGAAAGLAFGFKSLHLLGAGFLGLALLWQAAARIRSGGASVAQAAAAPLLFGGAFLLAAGYWLLRNLVVFGNPLFPVTLPLLGGVLGWAPAPEMAALDRSAFQLEWVRSSSEWLVYPWLEWHHISMNYSHGAGLGMFFAAFVPMATVWSLARLSMRGRDEPPTLGVLTAGGLFLLLAWFALDDRQPRYAMGALVFLLPIVGWAIARTAGGARRIVETIAAASIVFMLLVVGSKELVVFGDRILYARQFERSAWYEYPPAVDRLPAGSTILVLAPRAWHFPLAGAALGNRIVSMPEARKMLGFGYSLSLPEVKSIALEAKVLRAAAVTHVFTTLGELSTDDCLTLKEISRLEFNPYNRAPLPTPRRLLEVGYCDALR